MQRPCIPRVPIALAVGASLVILAATVGRTAGQDASGTPTKAKADPKINEPFRKPNVKDYVKKFETEDRENYAHRHEIVAALELKPGMAVADVGAGTGLFTRLFADKVGPSGKVYAVDIAQPFLDHIAADAKKRGQSQVVTVLGSQDATNLPAESVNLVFLSDVYHHLEKPEKTLASIRRALKPGGRLVVIEFDRVEGRSSAFVLKHVRASQAVFRKEIEDAGFTADPDPQSAEAQGELLPPLREVVEARPGSAGSTVGRSKTGRAVENEWPVSASVHSEEGFQFRRGESAVRHRRAAPGGPGSRPRRTPGPRRRATTARLLPARWPGPPPLAPALGPAGDHAAIGRADGTPGAGWTSLVPGMGDDRRSRPVCQGLRRARDFAGLVLVSEHHREPSLDAPNPRPASASLQGPKIAHGFALLG